MGIGAIVKATQHQQITGLKIRTYALLLIKSLDISLDMSLDMVTIGNGVGDPCPSEAFLEV